MGTVHGPLQVRVNDSVDGFNLLFSERFELEYARVVDEHVDEAVIPVYLSKVSFTSSIDRRSQG